MFNTKSTLALLLSQEKFRERLSTMPKINKIIPMADTFGRIDGITKALMLIENKKINEFTTHIKLFLLNKKS
jgi:hypothetical protein